MDYRTFQINDSQPEHLFNGQTYFAVSMQIFLHTAPSTQHNEYDYINIVELTEYERYPFGNMQCAQGYRHRSTGWTFPDLCRQHNGCPEIWHQSDQPQLEIADDSPILDCIYRPHTNNEVAQ